MRSAEELRPRPRLAEGQATIHAVSVENCPMADFDDSMWQRRGATLSDKSAIKEYGLTRKEVVDAIKDGRLPCRENSIHGNPFLRLLRHEVEALVKKQRGGDYLRSQRAKAELAAVDSELKKLKKHIATLEQRKSMLLAEIEKLRRSD